MSKASSRLVNANPSVIADPPRHPNSLLQPSKSPISHDIQDLRQHALTSAARTNSARTNRHLRINVTFAHFWGPTSSIPSNCLANKGERILKDKLVCPKKVLRYDLMIEILLYESSSEGWPHSNSCLSSIFHLPSSTFPHPRV